MHTPPSSHFIYIPVVLILGIVLGFILGARATRDAIQLEQRRQAERDARKRAREARTASGGGPPDAG
jgi:type II secretory pathway pseudopilin PulG